MVADVSPAQGAGDTRMPGKEGRGQPSLLLKEVLKNEMEDCRYWYLITSFSDYEIVGIFSIVSIYQIKAKLKKRCRLPMCCEMKG